MASEVDIRNIGRLCSLAVTLLRCWIVSENGLANVTICAFMVRPERVNRGLGEACEWFVSPPPSPPYHE